MLSLLAGRYIFKNKYPNSIQTFLQICQMCNMCTLEDTINFIIYCPYLDGARAFFLLQRSHSKHSYIKSMYLSVFQYWPHAKIIQLLLDPLSQISPNKKSFGPDFLLHCIKFSQDFLFSIYRQCSIFLGDNPWSIRFRQPGWYVIHWTWGINIKISRMDTTFNTMFVFVGYSLFYMCLLPGVCPCGSWLPWGGGGKTPKNKKLWRWWYYLDWFYLL